MSKPRLLVHICCAPDALYVLQILKRDYDVAGLFYNPNIHPDKEYRLRLDETKKVVAFLGVPFLEGRYDSDRWLALTENFRREPEKGRRCDICYALRLFETAETAAGKGFDSFTTVMSLSPWKKADVLNRIGRQLGRRFDIDFLEADFKKKDGFKKSIDLSRNHGLYRQAYCGCVYSLEARRGRE